jgi:hypothetical protein
MGFSSFSFHSRVSNLAIFIDASQPQEKKGKKRKEKEGLI